MSTAWYRTNVIPKLIRRWQIPTTTTNTTASSLLAIEVWDTTCIVTNFQDADMLINSSNPSLSGVSKFPYFPKGGPEPSQLVGNKDAHPIMGYVSQWGGMEVGQGMLFAANVVDGLVHQMGGKDLLFELQSVVGGQCQEGDAVWTKPHGDLKHTFPGGIIHTVPPFYDSNNIETSLDLLKKCYWSSLDKAFSQVTTTMTTTTMPSSSTITDDEKNPKEIRLACPLLGAGCRGFPLEMAIDAAAHALKSYPTHSTTIASSPTTTTTTGTASSTTNVSLAFAIPSGETRAALIEVFEREF